MFRDPLVRYPFKAFGPFDLSPIVDRCINCEKSKKIITTVTIDQRSGPCCYSCIEINAFFYFFLIV